MLITTICSEGFTCPIVADTDGGKEHVYFTADGDIDADGANGQHGKLPAYMVGDKGSEFLANGGMKMLSGKVVGATTWFQDIVLLNEHGQPREFPGGIIASKTAFRWPGYLVDDPRAYVDSETVPYGVVPPIIIQKTRGKVLGCRLKVTNKRNGKVSIGGVFDIGPRNKIGEVSIQMARELGLEASPRHGGTEENILLYELWPGIPAPGVTFPS